MKFSYRHAPRLLVALASLAVGAVSVSAWPAHAAPHASTSSRTAQITVMGTNFSQVPSRLSAGLVRLNVIGAGNNGNTQIVLGRLQKAGAKANVAAGMSKGINAVFPYISLSGGVGAVPHSPQTAIINLTAGTYVIFNLDGLTANKNPHSPYHFITVTGQSTVAAPMSAGTVRAVDFRFRTSGQFTAGYNTLQFINSGHEPHEMDLMRIAAGKTMHDVKMALMGNSQPKWAQPVGGWGVLSPGQRQWLRVQLVPGNYVLMCWIPDAFSYPGHKATNKPHVMLGMIKMIHVG